MKQSMSFKNWISCFENLDTLVGDLAKDIGMDKGFKEPTSKNDWHLFLLRNFSSRRDLMRLYLLLYKVYEEDTKILG